MSTTYKTNYDISTTGTDCELLCMLDGDASRWNWEENFELLETRGRNDSYYFYTDCTNEKKPDCPSSCIDWTGCTEKDCRAFCMDQTAYDEKTNPYGYTVRDCIETKRNQFEDWKAYAQSLVNEGTFSEYMQDGFPDIQGTKMLYNVASIRGYSQGDYATILYRLDDSYDQIGFRDMFTHYFYDAPICCRLTVNGEEYDLAEGLADLYDWNADKVKEYAGTLGLPQIALDFLADNLPDFPEYSN